MKLITGTTDFFGLDIGTTGIRAVQLHSSGEGKTLAAYGSSPVDSKLVLSDSKADQQKLMQVVRETIDKANITTKNVAVGLPSGKVFAAVVDIEKLAPDELAKTIRYQADSLIPTPLNESKLDWVLLGDSPADPTKVEILLSSVTNEFVENRLDLFESIGLNVIAFEPDSMALTRALIAPDATAPQLVIDIATKSTDLIIVMNGAPRLMRTIPTGAEALIRAAMQNLNIDEKQAQQFVFKFGLGQEKLEGQIYQAIIGTVDILVGEIDKSIKFFQSRYTTSKVERIIMTGSASALPEFPLYLANHFGLAVEIGNAWRNVQVSADRQNELMAVSNYFGVAIGLAERNET